MAPPTHLLFDFFGTLVSYSPSRIEQGYPRSHELLRRHDCRLDYDGFLELWEKTCVELEEHAEASLDEYSMSQACSAFLQRALPASPSEAIVESFRDTYVEEWNQGVHHIDGVREMLAELSRRYTLALVTNTHSAEFVRRHLRAMGIAPFLHTVVTSVEHGKRKPSPAIFDAALERSDGTPASALYVGDTYGADYLGAAAAGIRCLLIDPRRAHPIPDTDRLGGILDLPAALSRLPGR